MRKRPLVLIALGLVLWMLPNGGHAGPSGTYYEHDEKMARLLAGSSRCVYRFARDGWGDLAQQFYPGASTELQFTWTEIWRWNSSLSRCQVDDTLGSGAFGIANMNDTDNSWDWENGVWKDCYTTHPGGMTTAYDPQNLNGLGWYVQWSGTPCGGFVPDPGDASVGGLSTEIATIGWWGLKQSGVPYEGHDVKTTVTWYCSEFVVVCNPANPMSPDYGSTPAPQPPPTVTLSPVRKLPSN